MNANYRLAVKRRSGFTLIELLVVIAIIGILAGLLLAGVMVFLRKGPDVANRNDIQQLSIAVEKFKTEYKIYPRNTIKLCSNYSMYTAQPLDKASVAFINRMWPSLGNFTGINWANRTGATAPVFGNAANPQTDILDGDQCLVFFLGGPPMQAGNASAGLWGGFSKNPQNPLDPTVNKSKMKDFETGRLMIRPAAAITIGGVNYTTSTMFPSYQDYYSDPTRPMPFVYFSSTNLVERPDGYDQSPNSLGITPFYLSNSPLKFHRPETFQIISAGVDGTFGPGGQWTEATAGLYAGKDDMTNFYTKLMGN